MTEQFIEKAIKIHGNKYDYSKCQYKIASKKVIIICKNHGEFELTPNKHLSRGDGCKYCGREQSSNKQRSNTDEFIKKAVNIHIDECGNPLYLYNNVNYINANTKILITCKLHGDFNQKPNNHLTGYGCIKCRYDKSGNSQRLTTKIFIERSKLIHKDETGNCLYNYDDVIYKNSHTDVIINCKLHGDFNQRPHNHINGSGCFRCSSKNYSKKSLKWLDFISKFYNIHIQHASNIGEFKITTTNLKADGYCKETNTIYEFHGDYWHGNPKIYNNCIINNTTHCTFGELYEKTLTKENKIRELGYNLVIMWEYDWKKINNSIRILQGLFRNKHI